MLQSVNFTKIRNTIEEMPFVSPCAFCKNFSENLLNNYCGTCFKYLSYTKENDILIYNLSKFLRDVADSRDTYCLSWFDFERLEESIQNRIAFFDFLNYFPKQLGFYIDFSLLQTHSFDKTVFANAFSEIFNCISEFLFIDKSNVIDKKMLDGTVIDYFLSGEHEDHVIYMNGFRHKIQTNPITRHELKQLLCENISFLN
jgi:hypothetical protein